MPFIQRVVKPEFVSRSFGKKAGLVSSISDDNSSNAIIAIKHEQEFESITNVTLSNALRQMASVVIIANDIFLELNSELEKINNRTKSIKQRIQILDKNVGKFDPKEVEVPESDFETFVQIKDHFKTNLTYDKELFVKSTRPINIQNLYEAAGKAPTFYFAEFDTVRDENNTTRNSDDQILFSSSNIVEQQKSKINTEIEIRLPEAVTHLRKWTSSEALGEVTVTPDCIIKVSSVNDDEPDISTAFPPSTYTKFSDLAGLGESNDTPIDHRLPSPEEQCQLIATKYPPQVVSVDITGRQFQRMCHARKSTRATITPGETPIHADNIQKDETERKSRTKKSRSKRRNTVIGTDPKEISEAIEGKILPCKSSNDLSTIESISEKSKSSDLLRKEPSTNNESSISRSALGPLNSLKLWGRNRLKLSDRFSDDKKKNTSREAKHDADESSASIFASTSTTNKNKKKFFEKGKSYFSISNNSDRNLTINYFKSESTSNSPESIKNIDHSHESSVKLRESSSLRRQRRNDLNQKDDPPHSSSGNWSASSESGRASIGSEVTILPKSSASSVSLNHNNTNNNSFGTGPPSSIISRRRFLNTSASSSVTSEGPSTPDPQIMNDISFIDDETSSSYSCDTEGYYTSFHIDSGLKTLREEEPVTPLYSTSALSSNNSIGTLINQTGENEYDLFGRGSTSTTASSAGTVCTTLILPNENDLNIQFGEMNENKLSYSSSNCSSSTAVSTLERCATIKRNSKVLHPPPKEITEVTIHSQNSKSDDLKLNNSSNENNENNEKNIKLNQQISKQNQQSEADIKYELECAEYSDVESVDRSERIRQKTAISSSRIPSMCIITPTTSDDENTRGINTQTTKINREVQYPLPKLENTCKIDENIDQKFDESHKSQEKVFDIIKESNSDTESLYDNPTSDSNYNTDDNLNTSFDKNLYHTIGEYVTLADNSNFTKPINMKETGNNGIYYSNKDLHNTLSTSIKELEDSLSNEYISLKELPCDLTKNINQKLPFAIANSNEQKNEKKSLNTCVELPTTSTALYINEIQKNNSDMRVKFNAQGKIIFSSDSLRRQKNRGHSTFLPGPHVKDADKNISSLSSTTSPKSTISGVSNINKIINDTEDDCYVQLINKNIKKDEKSRPKVISGGLSSRPIKNIRPINQNLNRKIEKIDENNKETMYYREIEVVKNSANEEIQQQKDFQNLLHSSNEPFNRNAQIYGTLPKKDALLYRNNKILPSKYGVIQKTSNELSSPLLSLSPIVPCDNKGTFKTSTPSKLADISYSAHSEIPPKPVRNQNFGNSTDEIPKVCSDRMGASKTSLMDFKKLLLAKSSKNSLNKLSAVEMLKVASKDKAKTVISTANTKSTISSNPLNKPQNVTNSSLTTNMLLLDLSRSPRSFASRRMIRQGQFGSPGKYISSGGTSVSSSKKRIYGVSGAPNTIGTDVMSTTIPETNKEDDSGSSSGSIGSQISIDHTNRTKSVSNEHINLKNNFFLQAEENNFMKSEIDNSKYRSQLSQYREELAKNVNNEITSIKIVSNKIESGISNKIQSSDTTNVTVITSKKPPSYETSL